MKKKVLIGTVVIWVISVSVFFNIYAYQIVEINAKFRVFVTSGKFEHRVFNVEGLPVSQSPRMEDFVSPFYVVHYGLYYSTNIVKNKYNYESIHWRNDPSLEYWNVPPDINEVKNFKKYFYNCADWLANHVDYRFGAAHFLYNFDWPYKGYPSGQLRAPWWSGLTDGYAIVLLLRAYEYFGEERFVAIAKDLYESVLLSIDKGGSLSRLDGMPWIEEYVDPRFEAEHMAYVFNGMVYATYGIEAYEEFFNIKSGRSKELYSAVFKFVDRFNNKGWSYYDLIGNSNNIKYHKIHAIILKDLLMRQGAMAAPHLFNILNEWNETANSPGFYYVLRGPAGIALYHFICLYFLLIFFPLVIYIVASYFHKKYVGEK